MLIRVRSNVGVWRVDALNEQTAKVQNVLQTIAQTRPDVVYEKPLSLDPACQQPINPKQTLAEAGLVHGAMIYCRVDPTTCADNTGVAAMQETTTTDAEHHKLHAPEAGKETFQNMRRVIDKNGCIKLVPSSDVRAPNEDKGFRKGMLPLRAMKMHWTLADFMAMDAQFEFKIKRQESAVCKQVSLDIPSITGFQSYLQRFNFNRKRFGFLYGKFIVDDDDDDGGDTKMKDNKNKVEKKPTKVLVEAIYEPPQEPDKEAAEGFQVLDDPNEEKVNQIAALLQMQKVGWIFGHEERQPGFVMNAAEIIMAAEFQLEAANGVEETPFVTVKVAPSPDGTVSVEAFQVSQQCMAMVAEQALEIGTDPKCCAVNETFTAIQEGKESKTVENNFFLCVVPIVQHTSDIFVAEFPRCNRDVDERVQSNEEMKRHLSKSGSNGWTFEDRLADFNLLLFLSQYLDLNSDYPKICDSILDRSIPLDDGYKLLIKSLAGMDGSY